MKFLNLNPWDTTLVKLNELFNKKNYKSIKKIIEDEVINNNFMFKLEKERIINTYCIFLKARKTIYTLSEDLGIIIIIHYSRCNIQPN